jgi:diphthine synthase
MILSKAKVSKVGFLVAGDPMNATTHVDLRLRAHRAGIKTRIIHAASVASAVVGATGLQSYKFGRTVTVPIAQDFPESIYTAIKSNLSAGLHTLMLLEIDVEANRRVTISEALKQILSRADKKGERIITSRTLVIAVARLEAPDMIVRANTIDEISRMNFGNPPYTLVIPGPLHFVEAEALEAFCGAPKELLE